MTGLHDTFGGAILAWVKSPRRGAGIELPASLRHRLRQGRLHRHPERKREALKSKDPVGEASPCLQPLCPRVPQTVIPATFSCHPRAGGDLLSNPRPNRLSDTPSPRGSAPKTLGSGIGKLPVLPSHLDT
jgi:hypothetical protein